MIVKLIQNLEIKMESQINSLDASLGQGLQATESLSGLLEGSGNLFEKRVVLWWLCSFLRHRLPSQRQFGVHPKRSMRFEDGRTCDLGTFS